MTIRLALFAAVLAASSLARSQEMSPPKPGKEHEVLKTLAGEWDCTTKFAAAPGQEPTASKAKESARLIAGGLFLVYDVEGEMMGAKFTGHGTMGYDTQKKEYTGSWVDSMATGVYFIHGTYDPKTKTFTETMEGSDPASGQPMKMKMVQEIKDNDSRVTKFMMNGPDGKEMQIGTLEYKRKK